jgi:succinate-semialdehyde dehydrogenase / glutarate-semialdehyde dehydrogenase
MVFGDAATISKHLIASPIVRKVSFTGSTAVGKMLMKQCAEDLKRTTMELGGHGPVLVFDDIDVDKVAEQCALGKYRNAGQVCVSPTRFFVQEDVYDRFLGKFVDVAKTLRVGDGLDKNTQMGPLANARRVEAMEEIIQDVEDRGGRIEVGGRRRGNEGYFFDPSVVTGLGDDSKIMTDEPFGPIAPITPFKAFDEVIERANALPYGLAGYAFTTSTKRTVEIGERLNVGMVGINGFTISQPETPFGGINDSGQGWEGGTEGLESYLNTKQISATLV